MPRQKGTSLSDLVEGVRRVPGARLDIGNGNIDMAVHRRAPATQRTENRARPRYHSGDTACLGQIQCDSRINCTIELSSITISEEVFVFSLIFDGIHSIAFCVGD